MVAWSLDSGRLALEVPLQKIGRSLIFQPLDAWGRPADAGRPHDRRGKKASSYIKISMLIGGIRRLSFHVCHTMIERKQ
jgi:hypothetical protein